MTKVAIFASGSGSNFENIVSKIDKGQLNNIEITFLYTDHHDVYCIERAKQLKVMVHINEPKDSENKGEYEQKLIQSLHSGEAEWIILAGYMRLVGPDLLNAYEGEILNIHPSLLPKYKGRDTIDQAFNSGDKETGSTVHYVDSGMDTGEIIERRKCDINPDDTKETSEGRVKQLEYELYPNVIAKVVK